MGDLYCKHGHLAGACESCQLVAGLERGQRLLPAPPTRVVERVMVEADTVVVLGDDLSTRVNAGDLIPIGLEDRPRSTVAKPTPAPAEPAKPSRRRPAPA